MMSELLDTIAFWSFGIAAALTAGALFFLSIALIAWTTDEWFF